MNVEIKRLKIKKLTNTRDLGGLPVRDGRHIRYGKLIRSGKLYKLPAKSKRKLRELGVNLIVDLRMDMECKEYPCDPPADCAYEHLPLLCTMKAGITHEKKMRHIMRAEGIRIRKEYESADGYMMDLYREFVSLPEYRHTLSAFLRHAVQNEGCMLWCCTAGKDRTGVCAMLLEGLLGVEEEVIMQDYVASSQLQRSKSIPQKAGLWLLFMIPPSFRKILITMMKADPAYLGAAIGYIKEHYGSITDYCKEELGITDADIEILKNKYLE